MKTDLLSDSERAIYRKGYLDALREAAEILDAGLNRGSREHNAILARAKELEK